MVNQQSRRYFAASNSADGFVNYFPQIFKDGVCKRLYVIKGGPGTGKSYFMKRIGERAEKCGYPVTYYCCSSDPESLDGLLIGGMDVGFVDGTAPHVWEPGSVGVFEQIVNLGQFWDADLLWERRDKIRGLSAQKQECYRNAYHYLAAYGHTIRAMEKEMTAMVDGEKMFLAAERLLKKNGARGEAFCEQIAVCDSVGMGGRVRFDTYETFADTLYTVRDYGGTSYLFFDALYQCCRRLGASVCISRNPLLPERVDALMLTANGVTFTAHGGGTTINMKRFVKETAYKNCRNDIRTSRVIAQSLIGCAERQFERIRKIHFAIEALFSDAMDFVAKEAFTEDFCTRFFDNK